MSIRNRRPVTPAAAASEAEILAAPTATVVDAAAALAPNQATDTDVLQDGAEAATIDDDDIVEGRVIIAFGDFEPNELFVGPIDEAEQLEREGRIDCHPGAVAYAKSLIEA